MFCEECGKNPATVHITKIINGVKSEKHLCEKCAKELGDHGISFQSNFTVHQLLAGLLDSAKEKPVTMSTKPTIKCPLCGKDFENFSQVGRFGCSKCYTTFEDRIKPVLRRIHGSNIHTGKVPRRTGGVIRLKKEIDDLKKKMEIAVQKEEFEKAAEIRDKIKQLENNINE